MIKYVRNKRRRTRSIVIFAASAALTLAAAACGSSSTTNGQSSGSSGTTVDSIADLGKISPQQAQEAFNKALLVDSVSLASQPPVVREAMQRASLFSQFTQAQLDTAYQCWQNTTCQLGKGSVTLGVPVPDASVQWKKISKMQIVLQAMTYPSIGRIIFTDGQGDLAKYQADIRSLAGQGANLILTHNLFGAAAYPALKAARAQGAAVATYIAQQDGAQEDTVSVQVHGDNCQQGTDMAKISNDDLKLTGDVAVLNGVPGNPQGQAWNKCFEANLKGATVGGKFDTNWALAGAYSAGSAMVSSGKNFSALFYDYADPIPQVIKAYSQAGKKPPAVVTWTDNNGLAKLWEQAQGTPNAFPLYYTNSVMWETNVALTAGMESLGGNTTANVTVPTPFVEAKKGLYLSQFPDDYPGPDVGIPDSLLKKMLG